MKTYGKKLWWLRQLGLEVVNDSKKDWICECPFCHNEELRLNAMNVVYECEGCGKRGDYLKLMNQLALDFPKDFLPDEFERVFPRNTAKLKCSIPINSDDLWNVLQPLLCIWWKSKTGNKPATGADAISVGELVQSLINTSVYPLKEQIRVVDLVKDYLDCYYNDLCNKEKT